MINVVAYYKNTDDVFQSQIAKSEEEIQRIKNSLQQDANKLNIGIDIVEEEYVEEI